MTIIVALALGASIRAVNSALYTVAVPADVLIALDRPHPSNIRAAQLRPSISDL